MEPRSCRSVKELEFVSLLGPATADVAVSLSKHLADTAGVEVRYLADIAQSGRRRLVEKGEADLMWMCGHLTRRLVDSGALDAEIVAAPIFPGRGRPVYHSVVVVASDSELVGLGDLRGATLAINEDESWSGNHAMWAHLDAESFDRNLIGSVVESGSHAASMELVRSGTADCAAIDVIEWDRARPAGLRVIDRTRDWPAPPFSVGHRLDQADRVALTAALLSASGGLESVVAAVAADYDVMAEPPVRSSRSR